MMHLCKSVVGGVIWFAIFICVTHVLAEKYIFLCKINYCKGNHAWVSFKELQLSDVDDI